MSMKPEIVEEVINILNGLRQAFAQILPTQEGVASLAQPRAAMQQGALCPRPAAEAVVADEASQPQAPVAEAEPAAVAEAAPEAAPAAPAPEPLPGPMTGPVNPTRFRAANAYANSR